MNISQQNWKLAERIGLIITILASLYVFKDFVKGLVLSMFEYYDVSLIVLALFFLAFSVFCWIMGKKAEEKEKNVRTQEYKNCLKEIDEKHYTSNDLQHQEYEKVFAQIDKALTNIQNSISKLEKNSKE